MTDFLSTLVKDLRDEYTTIAADRKSSAEYSGTIDTGSYALNALFSGSIYGGVPNNKITALAGESATGKTYFALGLVRRFLETNEGGGVVYFDTESVMKDKPTVTERAAFYIGVWQSYCYWFFKTKNLYRKEKYAKK